MTVGGGSVIDCCKIVSAQAMLEGDIWELEMVKRGAPTRFLPMGCVVTVSGTGSEMNNGAVITNEEKKIKLDGERGHLSGRGVTFFVPWYLPEQAVPDIGAVAQAIPVSN